MQDSFRGPFTSRPLAVSVYKVVSDAAADASASNATSVLDNVPLPPPSTTYSLKAPSVDAYPTREICMLSLMCSSFLITKSH